MSNRKPGSLRLDLPRILLAGVATVAMAGLLGVELPGGDADQRSGSAWRERPEWANDLSSWTREWWLDFELLPRQGTAPGRRRRDVDALRDARRDLVTEQRRRIASEQSLSLARTQLRESEQANATLGSRVRRLERDLAGRQDEILDLRVRLARASTASPEIVDVLLGAANQALRAAQFDTALELTAEAEQMLVAIGGEPAPGRVARLEVARATAQLAMGLEAEVDLSLTRLLAVAPDFHLDESTSPARLVRALERVRAESSEELLPEIARLEFESPEADLPQP